MAFVLEEAAQEDMLNRSEVFWDPEMLSMRPLHLGQAFEKAKLALQVIPAHSGELPTENELGQWYLDARTAYLKQRPETQIIW